MVHSYGSADVVVAGGGIVGAACAFFLARRGASVIVLERGGIACGSTSATQGLVGYGLLGDRHHLDLQLEALVAYDSLLEQGFDFGFTRNGALVIPDGPSDGEALRRAVSTRTERGLKCEWLPAAELLRLEPMLAPSSTGGAYLPELAQVSPMRVALELIRHAVDQGAQVWCGTPLSGIEFDRRRAIVAVRTGAGRVSTKSLVLATGSWSRKAGTLAGLSVPVWPRKGHVIVIEPVPGFVSRPIVDFRYGSTVEVSTNANAAVPIAGPAQVFGVVQPLPSGQILVGGSAEFAEFDRSVSPAVVGQIARRAVRLVPALAKLRAIRTYTGFRPWTPDGRPLVGPTGQATGLVFATGHGGEGITHSVLTGQIVADLIVDGSTKLDVRPLSPDRFRMS